VGVELFRTIAAPCQLEKELQSLKKASATSTFPLFFSFVAPPASKT
jgi:hypothetical protein